jgi:hypothetical protein
MAEALDMKLEGCRNLFAILTIHLCLETGSLFGSLTLSSIKPSTEIPTPSAYAFKINKSGSRTPLSRVRYLSTIYIVCKAQARDYSVLR